MDARTETDVAHVAAAIGDPSRAKVLLALAGGGALPASALAAEAGVSNSTISGHLARLLDARLLTVELDGRHRYYRLATTDVARALEQLALIARPLPVRSLNADTRAKALLRARLCYDHLAGRLGVAVMSALQEREILAAERTGSGGGSPDADAEAGAGGAGAGSLDVAYVLTAHGRQELAAFGVETDRLPRRRASVRYCVDWAEQRHHLAGALGAALTARLFDLEWLRHGKYRRVVHLTDAGREGLATTFGVRGDQVD
ncbi:ArsR/SmtB family transcription factor [Streptomyces decoyicus]|uniref:ArsR/SmtB family transcription factor n=1 Tax=Streptomyces decoyicus TaxID=249567 RepID=UPI00069F344C|nr:helix-turn-helix transcriptional regulator [Streptomyces decoyicus]KOG47956.1 ArsR family transcriptional regulator [Streptomyces decoyicus]QZY19704.1 ArsR family transcriptional regulator [Streptomyces decoyicus]